MEVGKISETVLKRSVLKQIKHRRNEILVKPNVGEDCSILKLNEDELFVVTTDPITGATEDIGSLAIHVTANDLASSGAEPIAVLVTILLPEGASEKTLKTIMQDIEKTCVELDMEVIGGHTEVTKAVNQPIVSVMGIGKCKKDNMITTSNAKAGQDIVLTKWAGLEGTAIIAKEKEEELLKKYNKEFIESAKRYSDELSVIKESKIGVSLGVTSMHDVTEGGIFGALWELASSANLGFEVELNKIPIKQETIEICEFFNLNPYKLISSGCLLLTIDNGEALVKELRRAKIEATVIGTLNTSNNKEIIQEGKRRTLEPPKSDELYKIYI
ncbi:hydrogenase maturation factor [Natranaerovirga pectinivora]|uniref:Hydrogenase maturation factor n=1 Tax=Natranaerovirga pectinivora TaxID=682400 RepID=A0A4R3MET3_9FIRM|nr:AIR synthase family protein [Natranaerovirga pectinivora]TCT12174.1 hydrogenase maturation factor [Natranaerovirga pectinivora]